MARFEEPDFDCPPTFECCGCGYAFDLPADGRIIHACDCGADLCCECKQCVRCESQAERDEETRAIEERLMRARLDLRNRSVCIALKIIP